MNSFEIKVRETAAVISANFEEVRAALEVEMQQYKGMVFTDQQIPAARETVASLRKAVKEIEAKRKEVKKAHMIPYDEFEKQAKELVKIINGAIDPIDLQIKEVEESKRLEKKIAIENYFNLQADGNEYVCLADVWEDKWITNIRTSMKSIQTAIDSYIDTVNHNIESIKAFSSDVEDKALEKYLKTKQLSDAIMLIQEHERMKAEIIRQEQERAKAEEERRKREEEARRKAEEEVRIRAEEAEKQRIAEEAAAKAREEERQRIAAEMKKQELVAEPVESQGMVQSSDISKGEPVNFLADLPSVEEDIPFSVEEPQQNGFDLSGCNNKGFLIPTKQESKKYVKSYSFTFCGTEEEHNKINVFIDSLFQ